MNILDNDIYLLKKLLSQLSVLCLLVMSLNSYAGAPPPSENQCKSKWTIVSQPGSTGMLFGDFAVDGGGGDITLDTGPTRTSGPGIDLISPGSAVSTHIVDITNSKDPVVCAAYDITIDWSPTPDGQSMTGGVPSMLLSNALVYITGSPNPVLGPVTLPQILIGGSYTLPLTVEAVSTITAGAVQSSATYSLSYGLGVTHGTTTKTVAATAQAIAITALGLTVSPIPMSFGEVSPGTAGGTIIMDSSGVRSVGLGDTDVVNDLMSGTPGSFTVLGQANLFFTVQYTDGTLADTSGNTIQLTDFTDTSGSPSVLLTGLDQTFSVGATLVIGPSQTAGDYSTANASTGGVPYKITVNYD